MKSKLRRGFNLWELLAVMGMIAVGAALLWPRLARVHPSGNNSTCQNNLKQIGLGFKQYINDYTERYPLIVVTEATGTTHTPPYGWADALQPYVKNTKFMQCPTDTTEGNADSSQPNFSDYWYNANFNRKIPRVGTVIFSGANESMFGSTTQTIMAGDGGNTNKLPTFDARYNQCGDGNSLTRRNQICVGARMVKLGIYPAADIHLKGANFLFADGHIKWLQSKTASQSMQVMNNAAKAKDIGGNFTFSLLNS